MRALDFVRTLHPDSGIARSAVLSKPDDDRNPLWMLAVDIGQDEVAGRRRSGDDFSLSLVGAADVRRSGVYARAAGEAVERWALKPPSPDVDPASLAEVAARAGALWCLSDPDAAVPTYGGTLVGEDGRHTAVRVPAGAVDYPAGGEPSPDVDPSPSGTAAGAGLADAIERASKEILERDAALRSWLADDTLTGVDLDAAATREADLVRLRSACNRLDLELTVALLPSWHEEVRPIMAMIVDPRHRIAAAGLGLARTDAASATRAVQEALQVRTVLTADVPAGRLAPPPVVRDDAERARFWSSEGGVEAGRAWAARVVNAAQDPRENPAEAHWSRRVGPCLVVDLTPRLPEIIRDLGWAVAKVLPLELQPLRMSEEPTWNLLPGVVVRTSTPHPFV